MKKSVSVILRVKPSVCPSLWVTAVTANIVAATNAMRYRIAVVIPRSYAQRVGRLCEIEASADHSRTGLQNVVPRTWLRSYGRTRRVAGASAANRSQAWISNNAIGILPRSSLIRRK